MMIDKALQLIRNVEDTARQTVKTCESDLATAEITLSQIIQVRQLLEAETE